jgi:hypothetical protein
MYVPSQFHLKTSNFTLTSKLLYISPRIRPQSSVLISNFCNSIQRFWNPIANLHPDFNLNSTRNWSLNSNLHLSIYTSSRFLRTYESILQSPSRLKLSTYPLISKFLLQLLLIEHRLTLSQTHSLYIRQLEEWSTKSPCGRGGFYIP